MCLPAQGRATDQDEPEQEIQNVRFENGKIKVEVLVKQVSSCGGKYFIFNFQRNEEKNPSCEDKDTREIFFETTEKYFALCSRIRHNYLNLFVKL